MSGSGRAGTLIAVTCCLACGADDLFISADLGPNAQCEYEPDRELARKGEYDVAGGAGDSEPCVRPYVAHLLVRNDNDDEVVVESAHVKLMTVARETLRFSGGGLAAPALPNPFVVTLAGPLSASASGVVEVEVIPEDYGTQLRAFTESELLAEVELEGATPDTDLGSNRFTFPIAVCEGCRTFCASDPPPSGTCVDDPSVCVDEGC
jgi:hypothetical protein